MNKKIRLIRTKYENVKTNFSPITLFIHFLLKNITTSAIVQ